MSRKLNPIAVSALHSPRAELAAAINGSGGGPKNNLKDFFTASPRIPISPVAAAAIAVADGGSRRNDALSKSMALSSTAGSIKSGVAGPRSGSGPASQFGVIGTTVPSARDHRKRGFNFSHI